MGWAVFHVKGWGPEGLVWCSKPSESKLLEGYRRIIAGMSPNFEEHPKSLRMSSPCSIVGP